MIDEKVPVLIVGGGIVGLSAALFLLQHNVPFVLVERHSGTSIHPRARGVNGRTMELFREVGVDEAVREAGAALAPALGIYTGETLTQVLAGIGPEQRQQMIAAFANMGSSKGDISPTTGARVTQDLLEPVLLKTARERGGDLRFYSELLSFEQDKTGVTATIVDRATGVQRTIRADYMIAADGANSPIRRMLGVATSGRGVLGHLLNVLFEADLTDFVRGREFSICTIERPEVQGLLVSINNTDRWVFHIGYDLQKGQTPEDFPPERCKELIALVLDQPGIEIEIKSILPWESAMRVADHFQQGRVFLAGDAAHQMPPWGGQGANTGVADVHNLAWKLALVLKGQASPRLLETYHVERHPIGYRAAELAARMASENGQLSRERFFGGASGPGDNPVLNLFGLSYQYRSQAIISEDQSVVESEQPYTLMLDGSAGTRAAHLWVERQGRSISTLDLFGKHFVLLTGVEGTAWIDAASALARDLGIDIDAYRLGPDGDLIDPENHWQQAYGVTGTGAVLVRPDGFIAWRVPAEVSDQQEILKVVVKHLLLVDVA